jgi:hypothetical protein
MPCKRREAERHPAIEAAPVEFNTDAWRLIVARRFEILVLDRGKANLALARRNLALIEGEIVV